ncbi:MAG: glycine C-acetyltransferase [Bryobacterales bacterium]|nr:glycine C-acetyltransferase [Bryobacterales bacterium]
MLIYEKLEAALKEREAAGLRKFERIIASSQATELFLSGSSQPVLNFCANNYMGLANHPRVIEAAHHAMNVYGYGLSSVRFICGTQKIHKQLEERIARFLGMEDAILYTSCFDANGGLFENMLGADDAILSARLNHASIIDGVRLTKCKRFPYEERSPEDFERALKEAREGDPNNERTVLAITDGVFSMDGILAPLDKLLPLAQKYGALLAVDDCHATGFIGENGRGTGEHFGVQPDVITGTLGKALGGASGGFTAGRKVLIEWLRNTSRPYLFSNSIPPSLVAGAMAAMDIVESDEGAELRAQLQQNTQRFRTSMRHAGFEVPEGTHPIAPVMLGDARLAARMSERLLELGVYVIGFSFPVVPKGAARIRVQLCAAHTREQVDRCVEAFAIAGREEGILGVDAQVSASAEAAKPRRTMKAWVYQKEATAEGPHISLKEVSMPRPMPGELLVKIRCASVCGTDEDLFRGKFAQAQEGIVPGHELFGEIVDVGSNVRGYKLGQRVVAESHYVMPGYPEEGIIGLWGPSVNGEYLRPLNGGYAEYATIPTYCAHVVPKVLSEPAFFPSLLEGVGNDCLVAKYLFDNNLLGSVGIVGCGYHGLMTQLFAKNFGVAKLGAFEIDPGRLERAKTFGADAVFNSTSVNLASEVAEFTGGAGFDAIVDIAGGSRKVLDQCLAMVKNGGTLVLFGLYGDQSVTLNGYTINDIIFHMREFTMEHEGKTIHVRGITGREGIWPYLIDTVATSPEIQQKIMSLVTVMGTLEKLGADTASLDPKKTIKRAYLPFVPASAGGAE